MLIPDYKVKGEVGVKVVEVDAGNGHFLSKTGREVDAKDNRQADLSIQRRANLEGVPQFS